MSPLERLLADALRDFARHVRAEAPRGDDVAEQRVQGAHQFVEFLVRQDRPGRATSRTLGRGDSTDQ
jgi:hypothetical protein